jgi:hypothetical protein
MPFLRCQCRPPSASCASLQPWKSQVNAGNAQGGGAVVTDQPAREADQDRCQGRQPCALCHLPDGRGRGAATDVPRNTVANRPTAGTARPRMTARGQMRQATTAKVRLDAGKAGRFSVSRSRLRVLTASCLQFSVAKTGRRGDLTPQPPGIRRMRRMSVKSMMPGRGQSHC